MFEDSQGVLWLGTYGGLTRYADGQFKTYTTADGLSHDTVLAISAARDGGLWIGTNSGLNRFKDGRFTVYTMKDGLSSDYVRAVSEDSQGRLWAGAAFPRPSDGMRSMAWRHEWSADVPSLPIAS